MLRQKLSSFWWTSNMRYLLYFLREFTGVIIAFYAIFFLAKAMFDPSLGFVRSLGFQVISWIGLIAAIFHSVTWFWVTVKISPIPLKKPLQIFLFIILIIFWLALSYFFLNFFYEKP